MGAIDSDVVLFAKYHFHLSCLAPISDILTNNGVKHNLTTKRHKVYDSFNERGKKFKIFVIADEWVGLFRDCADTVITTGHSLVSKNTTFNLRNSEADYICTTSKWQTNEFIKRGAVPRFGFWETGYSGADRIFKRKMNSNSTWAKDISSEKMNILISPTYNKPLSIMENLMQRRKIFENLREYNISFKLHPVLFKKYPEQDKFASQMSEDYPNIYHHSNSHDDIADAILWADLMIGDCSGAIFLGIAGGIPVIVFDNPNRFTSEYYDEDGPEWTLRDKAFRRIKDSLEIPGAVEVELKHDLTRLSRDSAVNLMFGESVDGNSAERIATKIMGLL